MAKIQFGIAGFFTGAFIGLLIGLIERRIISSESHPAMLFICMALTIIFCGIFGAAKALQMERNRRTKN